MEKIKRRKAAYEKSQTLRLPRARSQIYINKIAVNDEFKLEISEYWNIKHVQKQTEKTDFSQKNKIK